MSDFDVRADAGSTIEFLVTVLNPDGTPIDLTLAGTQLVVTGKKNSGDAVPIFTKTWIANGGSDGIAITGAGDNVADVTVDPVDTEAIAETTYIQCDAVLTQPSGKVTTVARGVIKLRARI